MTSERDRAKLRSKAQNKKIKLLLPAPTEKTGMSLRCPDGFTKQMAKDVCQLIRTGSTPKMACIAVGVTMPQFQHWMTRGELMASKVAEDIVRLEMLPDEDVVQCCFYNMIMGALAKAAANCAVKIKRNPDWRAQAWRVDKIYSKFLDAPAPSAQEYGDNDRPVEGGNKVIIYMPENGRSTK